MFFVRQLTPADVDESLQVHRQLFEVKYSRDTIESHLRPEFVSLLLFHEDRIVGVAVAERRWVSFCSTERIMYLATFGILPEYRRRGLGRYLFLMMCRIGQVHYGVKLIKLHMLRTNTVTYDFYTHIGMKCTMVLPGYYHLEMGNMDALVMQSPISALPKWEAREDVQLSNDLVVLMETKQAVRWYSPIFCCP